MHEDWNSNTPASGLSADVAVVGGGAAGLATAIFCAQQNPSLSVLILDGAVKLGAKILVSGGGRCNVTNRNVGHSDFWGGKPNVVRRVLNALSVDRTVKFFESIGVKLQEEGSMGKLFPVSNEAQTVLDALLAESERLNVRIMCGCRVTDIHRDKGCFRIQTSGATVSANRVVLATGGKSLPKTGSDGFGYELAEKLGATLIPRTPGLDPLILGGDFHSQLSGISHPATISVVKPGENTVRVSGELLWTHFGISGPVSLDASRHWHRAIAEAKRAEVRISFLPGFDSARLGEWFLAFTNDQPKAQLVTALGRQLPNRIAHLILKTLNVDATIQMSQLSKQNRKKVVAALLDWPLDVVDGRGYKFAEVTAGGVSLSDVNPTTLESRSCPRVYYVGEILDVDGRIGGFNFQWAWSSAWVAGTAIAKS